MMAPTRKRHRNHEQTASAMAVLRHFAQGRDEREIRMLESMTKDTFQRLRMELREEGLLFGCQVTEYGREKLK